MCLSSYIRPTGCCPQYRIIPLYYPQRLRRFQVKRVVSVSWLLPLQHRVYFTGEALTLSHGLHVRGS